MEKLRTVFLGTPEFAVPTLKALLSCPLVEVIAVICQPDRPAGRGQKLHISPVKTTALENQITVLQPEKLSKSPEIVSQVAAFEPDLMVMVAFGQILRRSFLEIPKHGVINLHGSLLPHYRGAAPINWQIINGDTEAGITTMFTEAGVDTGPMLLKKALPLDLETNAEELAAKLSTVGAELVVETITKLADGTLPVTRQEDDKATFAPILDKEMGRIDWQKSALAIHNLVRGLVPWPGTFTTFRGSPLKIWKTRPVDAGDLRYHSENAQGKPGALFEQEKKLFSYCGNQGNQLLEILEIQPPNKSRMKAVDWLNGVRLTSEDRLTS